jgi:hypothetical protein
VKEWKDLRQYWLISADMPYPLTLGCLADAHCICLSPAKDSAQVVRATAVIPALGPDSRPLLLLLPVCKPCAAHVPPRHLQHLQHMPGSQAAATGAACCLGHAQACSCHPSSVATVLATGLNQAQDNADVGLAPLLAA